VLVICGCVNVWCVGVWMCVCVVFAQDITREFPVAADVGAGACSLARHWDGHGDIETMYCVESAGACLH